MTSLGGAWGGGGWCISCELALSIFPCRLRLKWREILSIKGQGVVAIRDVLLEGGLAFKTYLDKGEGVWRVKI